ncbi:hypothetical protein GCM10009733_087230 [Nonomuraea maheshkhaliensis]|uniref:Tetracyclin repressor-like C-terminal domain-containing protein n=1 Tax=Nonomuraea maheshkhaliensis TaxID=419590 RepID=A0ABP4SRN9_9ACTN
MAGGPLRDVQHLHAETAFERALERGGLPADTDPGFLPEMISGSLPFHWLMLGHPLDDEFLERVADFVLRGAQAGPAGGAVGA